MSPKKILVFIDWYKPGYKAGGPIRSISNMIAYLQKDGEFYIVTRDTDYLETIPYSSINSNKWNKLDGASVYYISSVNLNYKTIKQLIYEIKPDTIYCNSLFSPYFTLLPLYISKKMDVKRILATRGMLSSGALAIKNLKKKIFLSTSKIIGIFKNIIFHATSFDEEKDINKNFNPFDIQVLQNLPNKNPLAFREKQKEVNQLKIIYVGRIAPEKNTRYAIEVLKGCKQLINFDIYGPIYNKEYWRQCQSEINKLPDNVSVNYKGVLPHKNLNETLLNYHTLLLPSTGENYGHIIIEAMINSCIPIISNKTPWKDLESKHIGFDIDLSNPNDFTTKIDTLSLMNQTAFNKMSEKTHQFAEAVLDNKELVEKYKKLFQLQKELC